MAAQQLLRAPAGGSSPGHPSQTWSQRSPCSRSCSWVYPPGPYSGSQRIGQFP